MTSPVAGPSDLTPQQRKVLQNFYEYCDQPPTLATLLRKSLLAIGFQQTTLVGWGVVLFLLEQETLALIVWGIAVGVLLQQYVQFRVFLRIWPAVEAVIDRDRLDELVEAPPTRSGRDDWS